MDNKAESHQVQKRSALLGHTFVVCSRTPFSYSLIPCLKCEWELESHEGQVCATPMF